MISTENHAQQMSDLMGKEATVIYLHVDGRIMVSYRGKRISIPVTDMSKNIAKSNSVGIYQR